VRIHKLPMRRMDDSDVCPWKAVLLKPPPCLRERRQPRRAAQLFPPEVFWTECIPIENGRARTAMGPPTSFPKDSTSTKSQVSCHNRCTTASSRDLHIVQSLRITTYSSAALRDHPLAGRSLDQRRPFGRLQSPAMVSGPAAQARPARLLPPRSALLLSLQPVAGEVSAPRVGVRCPTPILFPSVVLRVRFPAREFAPFFYAGGDVLRGRDYPLTIGETPSGC